MKPLLVVYAKAPVPGHVKTRLIPKLGAEGAAQLHRRLVRDTLALAGSLSHRFDIELHTDVPTQEWPGPHARRLQSPGDLGAKLYATLREGLEAGRPFMLVIGSDSPTLPPEYLLELAAMDADAVLGPARDGGYYAIGCRKVHPDMFAGVPWSTAETLQCTRQSLERCGFTIGLGCEWFDIDEPEDLALLEGAPRPWLSVVIPALNEGGAIGRTLEAVFALGGESEVIVVDGQSDDDTAAIAQGHGATVLVSARGRGRQLQLGAAHASGEVLWFVHADTIPPPDAAACIRDALADPHVAGGNFDLLFDGGTSAARALTRIYPHLRKLRLCYGDSGIFVRRSIYEAAGGFQPYPIFEDLDLIQRIRRHGRFLHLPSRITTSSRRFEGRSFPLVFTKWTCMQLLYWAGVHPEVLGRWYAPVRARGTRR